ncbi:hypothetical protein [Streptomyces sp. NBC_00334]|uniref:hypothetical protein n=1 Tax=Streptomyces sp. NBC_00334 TaxID=2975713 RepID=UPI002E2DF3D7|nr:hypothetical protein [Streptomyces sp. NBC_00334]
MRRRTGAAGIAVAIAAMVPLADPAHAQDLRTNSEPDCRSSTYREAAQVGLYDDPGEPDPLCPDAFGEDRPDDGRLDDGGLLDDGRLDDGRLQEGRLDEGRTDGGGADEGRFDGGGQDQSRPGEGRPDGSSLEGGGLEGGRLDGGGLDAGRLGRTRPDEGHADRDHADQGGIREVRDGDDGSAGAAHPRGDQLPTISATSQPRPATTMPVPALATSAPAPAVSPAVTPTLGTRGGLGGASGTGPSDWDIGIGLTFVTGAALAAGYVIRRRRRA